MSITVVNTTGKETKYEEIMRDYRERHQKLYGDDYETKIKEKRLARECLFNQNYNTYLSLKPTLMPEEWVLVQDMKLVARANSMAELIKEPTFDHSKDGYMVQVGHELDVNDV